jgi:uncharacterized protein
MANSEFPTYFITPVLDRYLVYAPLHQFSVILDEAGVSQFGNARSGAVGEYDPVVVEILQHLSRPAAELEIPRGKITSPLFLGFITTRGCNMKCKYCDFVPSGHSGDVMEFALARSGIDAYLRLLTENGHKEGEIQFFGGEPFFRNTIVEFVVAYARNEAVKKGVAISFNVTTNGLMSEKRAAWLADNFDTVVLSLDGAMFQDRHRPLLNERGSYAFIDRTAKILSNGRTDLIIRACVTRDSVKYLPDLAQEFAAAYILHSVCFEPLTESPLSELNGLFPPDPVRFARQFCLAEDILAEHGIQAVCSGTDIDSLQASFCPVGKDAMLISPSGKVSACYLLESEWMRAGLELNFGVITSQASDFTLDLKKLENIRGLVRHPARLCDECLCRYHCAGGCYVNHGSVRDANRHDSVCVRTRLITIGKLLKRMGALNLYQRWLDSLVF